MQRRIDTGLNKSSNAGIFGPMLAVLQSLRQRGLSNLIPVAVCLFFLALVLYFLTAVSPIAPFVYTLF
jgi:hypothetical protein